MLSFNSQSFQLFNVFRSLSFSVFSFFFFFVYQSFLSTYKDIIGKLSIHHIMFFAYGSSQRKWKPFFCWLLLFFHSQAKKKLWSCPSVSKVCIEKKIMFASWWNEYPTPGFQVLAVSWRASRKRLFLIFWQILAIFDDFSKWSTPKVLQNIDKSSNMAKICQNL